MSKNKEIDNRINYKGIIFIFLLGTLICFSSFSNFIFYNVSANEEGTTEISEMAEEFIYSTLFGGSGGNIYP